ncbi:MAG: TonB-dependent receptor family protein [Chitinophagaceae bacterium]|nr:TonB-dependent receptor family protein [Chitinophagaceae bacterium]
MKLIPVIGKALLILAPACVLGQVDSAAIKDPKQTDTLAPQVLKEVIVAGSKRQFVSKDGNLIANIENTPLSAVADPIDLLSKLPSVIVSPDGASISIPGKGEPLIYIDNQQISPEDLRSLAVSDIKQIEIINNPSSKYEANGRAVIRIIRKLNKKDGWKAEIMETAAQRRYFLNRASANISVRKKKLELKGNIQYNYLETWEGNAFDFYISDRDIFSKYSVTAVTTRPQLIGSAAMFYQINETDYFSFNATARRQNESFPIYTDSYLSAPDKQESVLTSNYNYEPIRYYTANLNYHKKIRANTAFIGAQYTKHTKEENSAVFNAIDNNPEILSQNRSQHAGIEVVAARADIESAVSKPLKFNWGAYTAFVRTKGNTDIIMHQPDSIRHSTFYYKERNLAAYAELVGKIRKLSYTAGVRMEDVKVQSGFADNGSNASLQKDNKKLFPKASLSIPVDSTSSVTIKYAKTVGRPNYTNANQASIYINPYFEWANNINLNPSYTDGVEASYQLKDYSLALSIYRIKGPAYSTFSYNERENLLRRSEMNYESEAGVYATLTAPFKYRIWNSTNVVNLVYSSLKDPVALSGKPRPYVYIYSSNEIRLPKRYVFTVAGWAITKKQIGALEQGGLFSVDTSLTKTFGKNLSCTLRVTDMFASMDSREALAVNRVVANGIYYDRLQEVSVGLKYSLGKLKETAFKNKDVDESVDRIR